MQSEEQKNGGGVGTRLGEILVCVQQTVSVNPLTTDEKCTRQATLAACYQLMQTVLKIDFLC